MSGYRGILRRCMDPRFGDEQRKTFQKITGLKPNAYYDLAYPGGGALDDPTTGTTLAVNGGVEIWGFGAHGDRCAGQPGIEDDQIIERLNSQIAEFKQEFTGLTVFALFSTLQGGTQVWQA